MIYIQSNEERTLPHHFDVACALWGAIDSGLEYRLTSMEEVKSKKFFTQILKSRCFVGSVEFMTEVFNQIEKSPRVKINSDRKSETMKLIDAKNLVLGGTNKFIKPKQIKLFTGDVYDKYYISSLDSYPDDTEVLVYEPFTHPIVSEWRLYIHHNKIVDARNYSGDFKIMPNWIWIEKKLTNYKDFPIAYTIDVGILSSIPFGSSERENVIIEFNDMWAIGNYGMENKRYLRMLVDRYFEIIKN